MTEGSWKSPPAGLMTTLFERLPEAFYRVDARGLFAWVSPNIERVLGHTTEEMIGRPAVNYYANPDDREEVVKTVAAAEGAMVSIELPMRDAKGRAVRAQLDCRAVLATDGAFGGIEGAIRDVTDLWRTRETLRESEDRFRRLSDVATEAICIHHKGEIIDFNQAFEKLFGHDREALLSMFAWDVIDPRDVPLAMRRVREEYQDAYEVRGVRADGSVFPMEIHSKQSWMGEKPIRVTAIHDLTQRKGAEATVRLLSRAVDRNPVGVMVVGADLAIEYANPALLSLFRATQADVIGAPVTTLTDAVTFAPLLAAIARGEEWRGELTTPTEDGERWLSVIASSVDQGEDEGHHHVIQLEDITLRKEQENRLQHQAMFDALTDLPNRATAMDRLTYDLLRARETGGTVALLFVDLDSFKTINDSLGHEYGDELLVLSAERMTAAVGDQGVVARFGGDEFLVILGSPREPNTPNEVARRVAAALGRPFEISGKALIITASIGIAIHPKDGRTPRALLRNADTAMYQAKLAGRNRIQFFTSAMDVEVRERARMENALRQAIGTDRLFLHFQPLVAVNDGAVVGFEALLRWRDPELGQVPPDKFIPQAETSGLIVPIGHFVLRSACQAARRWLDQGHENLRICVNVSPRQFQEHRFVEDVRAILAETGLPATNLELEVTEGLLLAERRDVEIMLSDLVQMGVHLSIDDFGTGYSSLSYLERFTFGTLKIDRTFMNGMLERRERKVLVDTIVSMAAGLNLRVIAEGVETPEQLAHLSAIGCDVAQGYLFSRPVPEDQIPPLLGHRFPAPGGAHAGCRAALKPVS